MDSMAQHLVLVLLLGNMLWTSCLAAPTQCHFSSQAQCKHEGKHYSLGESWMESGCLLCTCLHPVGVGCCETVQHPVDYPAGCEVRVETETCRATLVQSVDPRLPCIFGALGSVDPSHRALGSQMGG